MVYKTIAKIIIFCLLPICLYSNIVYDKNEIIITEIDLDYYNQVYFENFGETQNDFEAIKNIVVIKKIFLKSAFLEITIGTTITSGGIGKKELSINDTIAK